ncbi:MAG TPA: YciI family protein [Terriglobales bacterium]|nr:YciI family protein [Terriglobales bacterium]
MKFVCLGYIAPGKFENMSEAQQNAMVDECFAYDDQLRAGGHFGHGEALQPASSARTLRWKGGKVAVTDGPYAETKEQIGGLFILEARDLDHAVELMSKHPAVNGGPSTFEIRPVADLSAMVQASEQRRAKNQTA